MPGLPKFTRYMTVNVSVPPMQNYYYSRAEAAEKKVSRGSVASAGTLCTITPAKGCKALILVVEGSAAKAGDTIKMETLQSGSWSEVLPQVYLMANGHFYFTFPCWKPDQDTSDGVNATVRLTCAGTGPWRGFILYFEELA